MALGSLAAAACALAVLLLLVVPAANPPHAQLLPPHAREMARGRGRIQSDEVDRPLMDVAQSDAALVEGGGGGGGGGSGAAYVWENADPSLPPLRSDKLERQRAVCIGAFVVMLASATALALCVLSNDIL